MKIGQTDKQTGQTQGRATQRKGRETQRKKEEIAVNKGGKSGQKCVSSEKDKIGRKKAVRARRGRIIDRKNKDG